MLVKVLIKYIYNSIVDIRKLILFNSYSSYVLAKFKDLYKENNIYTLYTLLYLLYYL
jgi:hypothetical protein